MRIHVSLPVRDLAASIRFYETFFGAPASKRESNYANFRLDEPPIHLALVESPEAEADQTQHYGIEVPSREELARWRDRATAAEIVQRVESEQTCCYALADKIWVSDPEGRQWEVWVRLADAPTMTSSTGSCCAAAEGPKPSCCG